MIATSCSQLPHAVKNIQFDTAGIASSPFSNASNQLIHNVKAFQAWVLLNKTYPNTKASKESSII